MRLQTLAVVSALILGTLAGGPLNAQPSAAPAEGAAAPTELTPKVSQTAAPVTVTPKSNNNEIASRLARILQATEVLENVSVRANEGVVFLEGTAKTQADREMASSVATKMEDVVGVVNHIRVEERALVDLGPAWSQMREMIRVTIQSLPLVGLAVGLLILTWIAARLTTSIFDRIFGRRTANKLVLQVASRVAAAPVYLIGIYLILRIAGLTQMAATVVGGTGLIGLVIGIAFRDIAENFLASILLSTQRPFMIGDLIEVEGRQGFVQSVTTRGTLLMTLEGNHLHIPNSTIYKAVIKNLSANPRQRLDFVVLIRANESASEAQEVVFKVLREHEAVLAEPEPLVLVERLGLVFISLRVYFWLDVRQHSGLKVRSAVQRLVKKGLEDASAESASRLKAASRLESRPVDGNVARSIETGGMVTAAEGNLETERVVIEQQAREARQPDAGTNLLAEPSAD